MELKLDKNKTYAVCLEGGGAKGSYEIGAWIALKEAGIKFNAVSGTSVGALNGAMMVMGDISRAVSCWKDIRLSKVIDLDEEEEEDMKKVLSGELELSDIEDIIPQAFELIKNRGLDVAPLREWIREMVDEKAIKESPVQLYVSTVSISDFKVLEVNINELPLDKICDMLLASAYHPSFRHEKLGGKLYTDGGVADSLPLHALVSRGYKDIIAIRIPGNGRERRFKIPEDVNITLVETEFDLGGVLNFDSTQAKHDMEIGYYDTVRVIYGLYGKRYCIDRTLSEQQALQLLIKHFWDEKSDISLREMCEKELPKAAKKLDVEKGSYYDMLVAVMELEAELLQVNVMQVYTDTELLKAIDRAEEYGGRPGALDDLY